MWGGVMMAAGVCLAGAAAAEPVMLSVRVVKAEPGRCTAPAAIEFPGDVDAWRVSTKAYHNGENDREVYFEIETSREKPPLTDAVVTMPGARAERVLVGKTDVPFRQEGDRVSFRLVDDRANGRLMQVVYRSPRGGYPIYFMHNWEMRRSEGYAKEPYPAKQLAAVKNYLLAAQEVFRQMGDVGPGEGRKFRGELALMDCEVAASRGHHDYPAHVHLMHYQFEPSAGGKQEWVSRLVPHYYMDDEGRIVRSSYAVLAGRGKSGELGVGDPCRFEDTQGSHVLDLTIRAGGVLELRSPAGRLFSLRPDPEKGPSFAVWGYEGDRPACRAEAHDDPEKGVFRYVLDTYADGKPAATIHGGYRYDPFTAKVIGKQE